MNNSNRIKSLNLKRAILFVIAGFLLPFTSFSNNIRITNVVNTNPGTANPILTFDVAWDNSWRVSSGTNNYDAAWVFVKYQKVPVNAPNCESYLEWDHAKMYNEASGFSAGGDLQYKFVDDSIGIFLHRSADGIGNISNTSVQVQVKLPVPTTPYAQEYNFKVFGIEMVYIPQGAFELGDGASTNSFNSIQITNSTTILSTSEVGGNVRSNIPAEYPKGYNAFHTMKYEITQQQYVDFLNTLSFDQQVTRTALNATQLQTNPGLSGLCAMEASCLNRNGIKLKKEGLNNSRPAVFSCDLQSAPGDAFNSSNDGQTIAMNYLGATDFYAYLDWAGLRPMTNLEFEKISRGPLSRIGNEFIWGTTNITQAESISLNNEGQNSETSTASGNGLSAYGSNTSNGPLRVGFSATGTTGRETSGAAYYGVMNLGGNVWELVTGGSNPGNLGYKLRYENLGDGQIATNGNHNVTNWLITTSTPYSTAGCGCCGNVSVPYLEPRGGAYSSSSSTLRTSDRSEYSPCSDNISSRRADVGGRGVR